MSGIRWTTGVGIAVGGVSGAVLALLGVGKQHPPPTAPAMATASDVQSTVSTRAVANATESGVGAPSAAPSAVAVASAATPEEPMLAASAVATVGAASSTPSPTQPPDAAFGPTPPLELPTTRDALLKAELYCDKRQDFDECGRAAAALEAGSAGPADPEQAKRFRRIALTHLVTQCEGGSAHACFVMAAKYRGGTELAPSTARAEALEKRGLELCRLGRPAVECPPLP